MKHSRIAVAGFTASMFVGAGTGLVLNLPGRAGASGSATSVTTPDDPTDSTVTTTGDSTTGDTTVATTDDTGDVDHRGRPGHGWGASTVLADLVAAGTITTEQSDAITAALQAERTAADGNGTTRPDPRDWVEVALGKLVTAGTLTQAQADAVTAAVDAARPAGMPSGGPGGGRGGFGGHGDGGFGGHGLGGFGGGQILDTAAAAIGITSDDLRAQLSAGSTIAEVATAKGVEIQTVIDAIVAKQTADITSRVTDMVNGVRPTAADDTHDTPAPDASTTTTTG